MEDVVIKQMEQLGDEQIAALSRLLMDVVNDGASIGFLPPLDYEEAAAYWSSVPDHGVLLWTAERNGELLGTVQLHLALKPNGTHRAEIAKLMVHPGGRRLGLGRKLMLTAEAEAARQQRTLLVLDTRVGDVSNLLYESLGFTAAGIIPGYARSAEGTLDATRFYYKKLAR